MYLAGLELTKLTYTRLEDNLVRHRAYLVHDNTEKTRTAQHVV